MIDITPNKLAIILNARHYDPNDGTITVSRKALAFILEKIAEQEEFCDTAYKNLYEDILVASAKDPNFSPRRHFLTVGFLEGRKGL